MTKLSISNAWEESKAIIARDGKLFVAVALALVVLPRAPLGAFSPASPTDMTPSFYGFLALVLFTAVIAQIAMNRLAIPPDSTVGGAIKRGIERFVPAIVALLIAFAAVVLIFFILAAIMLAAGLATAPTPGAAPPVGLALVLFLSMFAVYSIFQLIIPVAAVETGGPFRLLSRAWTLGSPSYWRLTAFLAIAWLGVFIFWLVGEVIPGAIIAAASGPPEIGGIGAILVSLVAASVQAAWTVVVSVMLARIYVQLSGMASGASVPSSGT
jgi:hypothetical protein